MSASTGAVALSSTKPVSVVMPAIPTPTPTNAVSSGRPAAMTEPNITTRMTAAAATPKSSPAPPDSCSVAATPENSTCSPASRPGCSCFEQGLPIGLVNVERVQRVRHGGPRDPLVRRDPSCRERVGDRRDVGVLGHAVEHLGDCCLPLRRVEPLSWRCGQHDVRAGLLQPGLREPLGEHVEGLLGLRAGDRELVGVRAGQGACRYPHADQDGEPQGGDDPASAVRQSAKSVQAGSHVNLQVRVSRV